MTHDQIDLKNKYDKSLETIKSLVIPESGFKSAEEADKAMADLKLAQKTRDILKTKLEVLEDNKPIELKTVEPKAEKDPKPAEGIDQSSEDAKSKIEYASDGRVEKVLGVKWSKEISDFFKKWKEGDFDKKVDPALTTNIGGDEAVIPYTVARGIVRAVKEESQVASLVRTIITGTPKYVQAIAATTIAATRTDENAAIRKDAPTTTTFELSSYGYKHIVKVSNETRYWAIQDFAVYVMEELIDAFAIAIENGILSGADGNDIHGILRSTGVAGFTTLTTANDDVLTLKEFESIFTKLKQGHVRKATLVMSPKTWDYIKNFKGNDGHYVFDEARKMTSKTGIILRGFPVVLSEYLQSYDEGAGANGIPYLIFGNFKEYIFTVTKPLSVTGSAEAYFENDLYGYRGTMHFDGGVRRGEAFLGIKNKKA